MELARETERADKFEKLALSLVGLQNETPDEVRELPTAIHGRSTWSELRRRLELADRKKFEELKGNEVPEGQEG